MLFSKQVVNCLNGIESSDGHFHEDGVPVAHGTIPKTGKFERLQLLAVLALRADEARVLVDEVGELVVVAVLVLCGANEVNGIEVSAVLEHLHILSVVLVYLA